MTGASKIAGSRKTQSRPRGYITDYRPQAKTRDLLEQVQAVLDEYREHWPLSARQVFYRLVGKHGFPKDETAYGRLCHHLANARRARLIPFDAIRDDGVMTVRMTHFDDADHFRRYVRLMAESYRRNRMAGQAVYIEVWCEAAGMIHQLADVAHAYSVPVFSSSGFDSLTAKKQIAERICAAGKPAIVLHLGDHDPSGASIFEVVAEDVAAFVRSDAPWGGVDVRFRRVALNAEQVARYRLPTAPPKASDSRSKAWEGETCQLEALAPDQIADLLRAAILEHLDADILDADADEERTERKTLTRLLAGPTDRGDD